VVGFRANYEYGWKALESQSKKNFKLQEWVVGFRAKKGLDSNWNYEMGCGLSSKDSEEFNTTRMGCRL
jgi:hypothetical protein